MMDSFKLCNKPLASIEYGKFLEWLKEYELFKKEPVGWH